MKQSSYLGRIWKARYFWCHLALSDIRAKYRRSAFGLLWAILQPLMMTLLLSFVMGNIFHVPMKDYDPFIFSGLILWEFVIISMTSSCVSFVSSEGYIKQVSQPLLIYSLRTVIFSMINFFCAFFGLMIWILIWKPHNFGLCWMSLLPALIMLFMFTWPIATINAFIGARFRDYGQFLVIMLQGLYYVSPVFFLPKLFIDAKLGFLLVYNPISRLLHLFRAPLLEGKFPEVSDYLFLLGVGIILWLISWIVTRKNEKTVIYYL